MLIQKSAIENGDIIVLKTVTGDEIIAKLKDAAYEGTYIVEKPLALTVTQSGALGFIPVSLMGRVDTLSINKHSIMFVSLAKEEYEQAYLQQVSGLLISKG